MGGDVYVLPSSIHESLVILASKIDDLAYPQQLVYDVNWMRVLVGKRLSNHVYRYSKKDGLTIAA